MCGKEMCGSDEEEECVCGGGGGGGARRCVHMGGGRVGGERGGQEIWRREGPRRKWCVKREGRKEKGLVEELERGPT